MSQKITWGAISPDTEESPGGRVMPWALTSWAEVVFWLSVGYLVTEYHEDAAGISHPVRVYSLQGQ